MVQLVGGRPCPLHGWVPRKKLERLGYECVLGKDIPSAPGFHICCLVWGISEMGVSLHQTSLFESLKSLY